MSARAPVPFPILSEPSVEVIGLHLEAAPETCNELARLLPTEELERARRYRSVQHQREHVVAHAWLLLLLSGRIGVAPRDIALQFAKHGKPRLAQPTQTDLDFNLSHSGGLAVYAFARGCAVGVDVEMARQIPHPCRLADRFFSPTEAAGIRSLAPELRAEAFLACWTRKEAVVKALGLGLRCPLQAFDVTIEPRATPAITRIDPAVGSNVRDWTLRSFMPQPGCFGAVAVWAGASPMA